MQMGLAHLHGRKHINDSVSALPRARTNVLFGYIKPEGVPNQVSDGKGHMIVKNIHIIGIAAVALSAFMAPSAFAANPEWLVDGAAVSAGTSIETKGDLILTDLGAPGEPAVLCEGILDGTIGPGGTGEVTKVLNLAGVEVSSGLGTGTILLCPPVKTCTGETEILPKGLPWKTQLTLSGTSVLDVTTVPLIGYEVICTVLGIKITDECTRTEGSGTTENMLEEAPADVLVNFNEQGGASCTIGGAHESDTEGFGLITALEGLSLTVSGDEVTE